MKTLTSIALKSVTVALVAGLFLAGSHNARADDEPKPLATAKHATGLVVDVLSLSIDNTQGMLKVTWRYTNPTKKTIRLVDSTYGNYVVPKGTLPWEQYWDEVSYTAGKLDKDDSFRYSVVRTVDGKYFDATDIRRRGVEIPAGGSYEMFACFAKPQAGVKLIHLSLPEMPRFENLPIAGGKNK